MRKDCLELALLQDDNPGQRQLIKEIANFLGEQINEDSISTAHRLPLHKALWEPHDCQIYLTLAGLLFQSRTASRDCLGLWFQPEWDATPTQDTQHVMTRCIFHFVWIGKLVHHRIPSTKWLGVWLLCSWIDSLQADFCSNPHPSPGQNAVQTPHHRSISGDQMPHSWDGINRTRRFHYWKKQSRFCFPIIFK